MNPVPDFLSAPVPSRWLRAFAWAARWLFIGALTAWLLLVASWGFLHGWIVPRIAQYRPVVEQQATRVLGVPVRIGSISAESVGWVPSFALNDVSFHDAAGRPALSLGRVVVALSPQSLAHLGFEQLYIEKPELDIRRLADGRITVAGLAADGAQSTDDSALEWLLEQSVQYANDRVQFGKPIGRYQAIQQQLALLAGDVAASRVAAIVAATDAPSSSRPASAQAVFSAAVAKARVGESATRGTSIAHQVHGAIGFTHEHQLHFATRRLWAWREEFGSDAWWAERLGQAAIQSAAAGFWPALTARQFPGKSLAG